MFIILDLYAYCKGCMSPLYVAHYQSLFLNDPRLTFRIRSFSCPLPYLVALHNPVTTVSASFVRFCPLLLISCCNIFLCHDKISNSLFSHPLHNINVISL